MAWDSILAKDFCKSVRDGTHDTPKQMEMGYKLVTSKCIHDGFIFPEEAYFISEKDYRAINERSLVEQWDVLMSMIGNGLGRSAVVKQKPDYAIKNLALFKVGDEYKAKWLHYYLSSPVGQGLIYNSLQGSGQPFISLNLLRNFAIPNPPYEAIKKIVSVLELYDNLIENNQKQIKLLEEAAQRLYKQWFIDLRYPGHETTPIVDGLPEGWRKEKLVDLATVQFGYAFDGSLFNSNGIGTPIVRIRNIPDGITNDYTTENAPNEYLINNGDIVVGMDGEFHINSWSGETSYLVQRSCCFKPRNPKMKGWLLWAIHDPIKFFEKTVVGATVAHLGKKHIDTIELLTGPEKLYEPFQNLFCKRQTLLNQNRKLAESRNRLLPKLMNGELEV